MNNTSSTEFLQNPTEILQSVQDSQRDHLELCLNEENYLQAVKIVQDNIQRNPLSFILFSFLGELYEKLNKLGESVAAFNRALELREIAANYEPKPMVWHLRDLHQYAEDPGRALELEGFTFPRLICIGEGENSSLVGRSLDGKAFLQFNHEMDEAGTEKWHRETSIIRSLNQKGCHTLPQVFGSGLADGEAVKSSIDPELEGELSLSWEKPLEFRISEFLRKDSSPYFGDIALALLEQKHFGIYIGKIQNSSLRYNAGKGICSLVGFKESFMLSNEVKAMKPRSFFEWIHEHELTQRYKKGKRGAGLLFGGGGDFKAHPFWKIFEGDALNLSSTHAFSKQITTGHPLQVCHSMNEAEMKIRGEVAHNEEVASVLRDYFPVNGRESIIDVGCGGGMWANFIARLGYDVTAIDLDHQLMAGCNIASNILDLPVKYQRINLDYEELGNTYNTACLFSVLSCFKYPEKVAEKISKAIQNRILLIIGLEECGCRRLTGYYVRNEGWKLETVNELVDRLENLFAGFSLSRAPKQLENGKYFIELKST